MRVYLTSLGKGGQLVNQLCGAWRELASRLEWSVPPAGNPFRTIAERSLMRIALTLLLPVLSAILLFWRLDGTLLWRDECSTANWARLMAESGDWLPRVFDGKQLIVQAPDAHDFNSRMLPAMQSWLQFYVAALAFKLLGVSTWVARLPFAMLGAVCLFVFYRLGVVLFGTGLRALLPPYLGLFSIYFLAAARQSRYYVLVVLAASLLLLEFCRYLRNPELAARRSFYLRIGFAGLLLYFSNYVSFVTMWASLGVFVLVMRDPRLTRGFLLLTAVMAAPLATEFWLFHAEFAASQLSPAPGSALEVYRHTVIDRGKDFWRMIPLVLLVPAAFHLFRRRARQLAFVAKLGMAVSIVVFSLTAYGFELLDMHAVSPSLFWLGAILFLSVPGTLLYCWGKFPNPGPWAQAALLAVLVMVISPVLTIAVGQAGTLHRHYYQLLPAVVLLGAVTTAGLERAANCKAAAAFFLGLVIWPNLNFNLNGFDQVVERQFFLDRSYNGPVVRYLRENVRPGDKVVFFRNFKGMTLYYYLPDMHWVGLLDSEDPRAGKFRGVIPEDQFDDYDGVDSYVVWDTRDRPRRLTEDFEEVWRYSYVHRRSWWDRTRPATRRTYRVYRRRT